MIKLSRTGLHLPKEEVVEAITDPIADRLAVEVDNQLHIYIINYIIFTSSTTP